MIRKNLFNYLPKLEKEDHKQIKKYLQSPFFKIDSRERVIKLFDYLLKFHPEYEDPKLTNEALVKKLKFPNIKNLKSILLDAIEGYLKLKQLNGDEHINTRLLTKAIELHGIKSEFDRVINKELVDLNSKFVVSSDDYLLHYQLSLDAYINLSGNIASTRFTYLEDAIDSLNLFYLQSVLKMVIHHQTISNVVNKGTEIDTTIDMINSVDYEKIGNPNILVSYNIYSYHATSDLDLKHLAFQKVKETVAVSWDQLSISYRLEVYVSMINMANTLFIAGKTDYRQELFAVHDFWISKKVHLTYKPIHSSLFFNIVSTACNEGKFEWVLSFMEDCQEFLNPAEKDQTIVFCEAEILFFEENYEDALVKLVSEKFLNAQFAMMGKVKEMQCLYALKDDFRLDTYLKNFSNFINRHSEISDSDKVKNINFGRYLGKITKARFNKRQDQISKVREDLLKEENIFYRTWLTEQLDNLSN